MKKILFLILFPLFSFAQKELVIIPKVKVNIETKDKFITTEDYIIYGLMLVAGMANGEHDYLLYHPDKFFLRHPDYNRQWWDPRISWNNKYSKSWLVQTFFVWITDENHLTPAIQHSCFFVSIVISYQNIKQKLKKIVLKAVQQGATCYVIERSGFHITYR